MTMLATLVVLMTGGESVQLLLQGDEKIEPFVWHWN